MTDVLGLNAYHADSAAVLLREGALLAGIEEERLNRTKHWAGFPARAVATVLAMGGTALSDVEHVAVSRDPRARVWSKLRFLAGRRPSLRAVASRVRNMRRLDGIAERLAEGGGAPFRGRVHRVEHHRAHLASAFFCSPFERAACLTVDGFGDFVSSMSALGEGPRLQVLDEVRFPHSLGVLYTAVTQFLGFPRYGDEYKVMGLASFGEPRLAGRLREVVRLQDGRYETDPGWFRHASEGVTMSWEDGEPVLGPLWSPRFTDAFGPPRAPGAEVTDRDRDLAASLQVVYEEALFERLRWLQRRTGSDALCLAGGCALNSVANGKVAARTGFQRVFIQPAAGDAGTALGAAQYVWHQVLGRPRGFVMEHGYWGPSFSDAQIAQALRERLGAEAVEGRSSDGLRVRRARGEEELLEETAAALAEGRIVGWYQGRSEWGPRALGNRSILADARRAGMKDLLNARIKRREPFRPFAPSVLEDRAAEYFEGSAPDPFMVTVYPIRPEKRAQIPAVAHVDGTGRLQTVSQRSNPRYWGLLRAFERKTGVPVLLNTSFNESEPIVNTPQEALDCFLRAGIDTLVLGDWVVERDGGPISGR
jgi:carbamoyltransferase